jgi:hypothetical protein
MKNKVLGERLGVFSRKKIVKEQDKKQKEDSNTCWSYDQIGAEKGA